jgi:cytochrome P450
MEENGSIQGLTDHELQESILTLLFAAHDASATILTWSMKFLNDDPDLTGTFRVRSNIDKFQNKKFVML